ncbi:hypothetical protein T01_8225 [Trichinella spiralis]|uniref:Uncharacterized protein n=1 Tax=Trichinella spiralis TaxID=6334 RepID=A0A0V0YR99_TRISP|nr:hypothetical protein T01_8225 [Trichinella spiralis]
MNVYLLDVDERIEAKVTYHVGKSNRNSKTFQLC